MYRAAERDARAAMRKKPVSRSSHTPLVGIVAECGEGREETDNPGRMSSLPLCGGWNLNVNKAGCLGRV